MPFSIDTFKSQLNFGGARPNLFVALLGGITGVSVDFVAMCKSAQLPASEIGKVEVPYMGRKLPVRGDRTYSDLQLGFLNDEDFAVRNFLEGWFEVMNTAKSNRQQTNNYHKTIYVAQFAKGGGSGSTVVDAIPIKVYEFKNCFPTNVSQIDLDWGTNDTIEEFTATFGYSHWLSNTTEQEGGVLGVLNNLITGVSTIANANQTFEGITKFFGR